MNLTTRIKGLRESGESIQKIVDTLFDEGYNISLSTVRKVCSEDYTIENDLKYSVYKSDNSAISNGEKLSCMYDKEIESLYHKSCSDVNFSLNRIKSLQDIIIKHSSFCFSKALKDLKN